MVLAECLLLTDVIIARQDTSHTTDLDNIGSDPCRSRGHESLRDGGGEAGGEGSVQLPRVSQGLAGDNHAVELQISQSDPFFWGNKSDWSNLSRPDQL